MLIARAFVCVVCICLRMLKLMAPFSFAGGCLKPFVCLSLMHFDTYRVYVWFLLGICNPPTIMRHFNSVFSLFSSLDGAVAINNMHNTDCVRVCMCVCIPRVQSICFMIFREPPYSTPLLYICSKCVESGTSMLWLSEQHYHVGMNSRGYIEKKPRRKK